eukprot:scaffold220_cov169-Amphora_coffeaeformis.AAC.13
MIEGAAGAAGPVGGTLVQNALSQPQPVAFNTQPLTNPFQGFDGNSKAACQLPPAEREAAFQLLYHLRLLRIDTRIESTGRIKGNALSKTHAQTQGQYLLACQTFCSPTGMQSVASSPALSSQGGRLGMPGSPLSPYASGAGFVAFSQLGYFQSPNTLGLENRQPRQT